MPREAAGDRGAHERRGLVLRIELAPLAAAGARVPFALCIENRGPEPVQLGLTGRPIAFDVIVTAADGSEVWRRLRGQAIPAVLQLRLLDPGEAMRLAGDWDQRDGAGRPVAPGDYLVRAAVPAEPAELTAGPERLRIVP